mmetsp:Transcript_28729/g.72891  ORF Transcript_28729/g.72891 Transcript_28729/m.72891 type:complete len:201 (-) Transcript_28729:14-616(-)
MHFRASGAVGQYPADGQQREVEDHAVKSGLARQGAVAQPRRVDGADHLALRGTDPGQSALGGRVLRDLLFLRVQIGRHEQTLVHRVSSIRQGFGEHEVPVADRQDPAVRGQHRNALWRYRRGSGTPRATVLWASTRRRSRIFGLLWASTRRRLHIFGLLLRASLLQSTGNGTLGTGNLGSGGAGTGGHTWRRHGHGPHKK